MRFLSVESRIQSEPFFAFCFHGKKLMQKRGLNTRQYLNKKYNNNFLLVFELEIIVDLSLL